MTAEVRGLETGLMERLNRCGAQGFAGDDPAFVEQVLKVRARRLAALRIPVDDKPPGMPVLEFLVAGESYALSLPELAEVMPLASCTPVPGLPQHLLGVTNVRGEIRPVLNLHVMLGLPETEGVKAHAVFLRFSGRNVGLRVDELRRIRFIDSAELTLPRETANGLPQRLIAGITPDTLILLDAHQILAMDVLKDPRADYRRAI